MATVGIDLGTSGVKVAVLSDEGTVLATASRTYPVDAPHPGWAQTDPRQWEIAAREACREAIDRAAGVVVDARAGDRPKHGPVLLDELGEPVRDAVLWPDVRATHELAAWRDALSPDTLADLANPLAPGMPAPVLRWLAHHEPDSLRRAARFASPKDYVRSRLVPGSLHTDPSDASATLLWDVPRDTWSASAVAATAVDPRILPEVAASTSVAGTTAAEGWGLGAHTVVATGSADVAATLAGLDAPRGRPLLIVGTGAQLIVPGVTPAAASPASVHTYRSWDTSSYAMAAVTNAGLALQRVVELANASWEELYAAAETVPTAATPVFLPFFTDERVVPGATAGRAGWEGVQLATTRTDLLYSALEGVAFTIAEAAAALPAHDGTPMGIVGGGSRARGFVRLIADALERPLVPWRIDNPTAVGTAVIASHAAGAAISPVRDEGDVAAPRASSLLRDRRERFRRLLHRGG